MKIIIPARGGSKRIPDKNITSLNGNPLISYAIKASLEVTDEVYVSTDSETIAGVARECGAKTLKRPKEMSTDFSPTNLAIEHFLSSVEDINYFACVQATSPLLTSVYLQKAIEKIKESDYDSIISVVESIGFYWNSSRQPINFTRNKRPRTQDMRKWYAENGAFYLTSKERFLTTNNLINGSVGFIEIPKALSFEIDTYEDLFIIESIMKNSRKVL